MDVLYASANGQKELLYCANTAAAIFYKIRCFFCAKKSLEAACSIRRALCFTRELKLRQFIPAQ